MFYHRFSPLAHSSYSVPFPDNFCTNMFIQMLCLTLNPISLAAQTVTPVLSTPTVRRPICLLAPSQPAVWEQLAPCIGCANSNIATKGSIDKSVQLPDARHMRKWIWLFPHKNQSCFIYLAWGEKKKK